MLQVCYATGELCYRCFKASKTFDVYTCKNDRSSTNYTSVDIRFVSRDPTEMLLIYLNHLTCEGGDTKLDED